MALSESYSGGSFEQDGFDKAVEECVTLAAKVPERIRGALDCYREFDSSETKFFAVLERVDKTRKLFEKTSSRSEAKRLAQLLVTEARYVREMLKSRKACLQVLRCEDSKASRALGDLRSHLNGLTSALPSESCEEASRAKIESILASSEKSITERIRDFDDRKAEKERERSPRRAKAA